MPTSPLSGRGENRRIAQGGHLCLPFRVSRYRVKPQLLVGADFPLGYPMPPAREQEGSPDMSRRFIVPHGMKGQAFYLPDKEFRSRQPQPFGWARTISSSDLSLRLNFGEHLFQLWTVTGVHLHGDADDFF